MNEFGGNFEIFSDIFKINSRTYYVYEHSTHTDFQPLTITALKNPALKHLAKNTRTHPASYARQKEYPYSPATRDAP